MDSDLLGMSEHRFFTKLLSISSEDTSKTRDKLFCIQGGSCALCKKPMQRIGAHRDHIITVKQTKTKMLGRPFINAEEFSRIHRELNALDNLRLTHAECNQSRR